MNPIDEHRFQINHNTSKLNDHETRLRVLEKAVQELTYSMKTGNATLTEGVKLLAELSKKLNVDELPTRATTQIIVWAAGAIGVMVTVLIAGAQKVKELLAIL